MKKILFFTFLIFILSHHNAYACSVVYEPNHPVTEVSSVIVKTSSATIYTTFDEQKYIKIAEHREDSCGPYRTYLRKDIVFGGIAVVVLGTFLIFKKKRD